MNRTSVIAAALVLVCGAGVCAFLVFFKLSVNPGAPSEPEPNQLTTTNPNRVPVPLNRGPEVADSFQGVAHPVFHGHSELAVTANWKYDRHQEGDTAFPKLVPRPLQELLLNLETAVPTRTYTERDFSRFLPPNELTTVGQTWAIDMDKVAEFLKQFHPVPCMRLLAKGRRGGPDGAFATLRAVSPTHYDIVFRFHAEFDVMPDEFKKRTPAPGAWFSPAMFLGQLIINRTAGTAEYFRINLPTDEEHNVHVTLSNGEDEGEVHGWMRVERMELVGGTKNRLAETAWAEQIAFADAQAKLAKIFFKFKEIDWVPFDKAQEIARAQNKPIFAVVASGALDNQTC